MKVGDYVAEITNDWQKHNKWMEFPDEKPKPLGIIVGTAPARGRGRVQSWLVLRACGTIIDISDNALEIVSESR